MSGRIKPSQRRPEWYAVFGAVVAREAAQLAPGDWGEGWGSAMGKVLVLADAAQVTLANHEAYTIAQDAAARWLDDAKEDPCEPRS